MPLPETLVAVGKNEPSFFYPEVPDEALEDQDQLVTRYRRTLGRERIWQLALGGTVLLWFWSFVQGKPLSVKRRSSRRSR